MKTGIEIIAEMIPHVSNAGIVQAAENINQVLGRSEFCPATTWERVYLLATAGAMIAAEIDRLNNLKQKLYDLSGNGCRDPRGGSGCQTSGIIQEQDGPVPYRPIAWNRHACVADVEKRTDEFQRTNGDVERKKIKNSPGDKGSSMESCIWQILSLIN